MRYRSSVVAVAALLCAALAARAEEANKYSAWEGMWGRGSPPGLWDPSKPPGPGQQAPLTPEYQAVYAANLAKAKAGVAFDPKYTCGPVGMPRVMTLGAPMEVVVKPTVVYMLIEFDEPAPADLHRRARLAGGSRPQLCRLFHRQVARRR